jgi:hypothetical protein
MGSRQTASPSMLIPLFVSNLRAPLSTNVNSINPIKKKKMRKEFQQLKTFKP